MNGARPRPTRRRLLSTGLGLLLVSTGLEFVRGHLDDTAAREGETGRESEAKAVRSGCQRPMESLLPPDDREPIPYDLSVHNNTGAPAEVTVRIRDPGTGTVHLERNLRLNPNPEPFGPERSGENEDPSWDGGPNAVVEALPVVSTRPVRYLVEGACAGGCRTSTTLRVTPTGVTGEEAVVVSLGPNDALDVTTLRG